MGGSLISKISTVIVIWLSSSPSLTCKITFQNWKTSALRSILANVDIIAVSKSIEKRTSIGTFLAAIAPSGPSAGTALAPITTYVKLDQLPSVSWSVAKTGPPLSTTISLSLTLYWSFSWTVRVYFFNVSSSSSTIPPNPSFCPLGNHGTSFTSSTLIVTTAS